MLFQIISLISLSYLSFAVPTLDSRQELDLCVPVPPSGSNLLLGGKVNIQDHTYDTNLYWNASFPKRDFSEGFTKVLLEVRLMTLTLKSTDQ
jgi:hypothetical protein